MFQVDNKHAQNSASILPKDRGRTVLYVCHPVGGDVDGNIKRSLRWISWLRRSFPTVTFNASWIAGILSGEDDADPAQREAGLVDCEAVVAICHGVVLVGGRISSGMERERLAAFEVRGEIVDLTWLGVEAPADLYTMALHGPVHAALGHAHYEHPMAGAR
jgi:hypothetical protein